MPDDFAPEAKKKPLVSVERQYETDVATGRTEVRVFVKMYVEARDSGLLAALGDRRWRTLCCLATYMDENGNCHPSQDEMARKLGVRRENVNLRIKELLAFRFNDRAVISVAKTRIQTSDGSRWDKNLYRVHPISGLAIFDHRKVREPGGKDSEPSVRKIAHRPVCEKTNTGESHINQNQRVNQKVFNPLPNNDQGLPRREGRRASPVISDRALRATYHLADAQLAQVHYLVQKQADVLGAVERDHAHYVKRAAEAVAAGHADLLDIKLSDFKQVAIRLIPTSAPAYFQTMWSEALGRQDDLRRTPRTGHGTSSRRSGFEPLGDILRVTRRAGEEPPPDKSSLA